MVSVSYPTAAYFQHYPPVFAVLAKLLTFYLTKLSKIRTEAPPESEFGTTQARRQRISHQKGALFVLNVYVIWYKLQTKHVHYKLFRFSYL